MSAKGLLRLALATAAVVAIAGGAFAIFAPGQSSEASTPATFGPTATPSPVGTPVARAGAISIYAPVVRVTLASSSAMYFTIVNDGDADSLQSVSCDASPVASLHDSVTQGNTGTMKLLQQIDVPAHGTVVLQTGGLHVMIEQVTKPLVVGDQAHCQLTFAKAGKISLVAPVRDYGQ